MRWEFMDGKPVLHIYVPPGYNASSRVQETRDLLGMPDLTVVTHDRIEEVYPTPDFSRVETRLLQGRASDHPRDLRTSTPQGGLMRATIKCFCVVDITDISKVAYANLVLTEPPTRSIVCTDTAEEAYAVAAKAKGRVVQASLVICDD